MRVRNWQKFQHYRNRRPPWIRLYREVAHERKFADLSDRAFRVLVLCWLLASEEEAGDGTLPPVGDIAFCHRLTEDAVRKALRELTGFVDQDASVVLADCAQVAKPEESRVEQSRAETDTARARGSEFDLFWSEYPRKVGKKAARKAWDKARRDPEWPGVDAVLASVRQHKRSLDWLKDDGQFVPHPTTWLNGGRWADTPKLAGGHVRETYVEDPISEAERLPPEEVDAFIEAAKRKLTYGGDNG